MGSYKKRRRLLLLLLSLLTWIITMAPAADTQAAARISDTHWNASRNAVTGQQKTRLVLDMTKRVEIDSVLSDNGRRIIITLKSTKPWKGVIPASPDQTVVEKISINPFGNDATQLILDLPKSIDASQYKAFCMAPDPLTNRPFQVVIDVEKAKAAPEYKYSAGLKNKVIAIDPGHGGSDPGAIGSMGTQEKALTLAIALQTQAMLEQAGAQVIMTRVTDVDVSNPNASDREELQARVAVGNNRRADVFVSIHINASRNGEIGGTTTYFYGKSTYDSLLAQTLQANLVQTCGLTNIGTRTANFYVVKNAAMPAALIELAFISNPQEEKLLNTPQFQQKAAQGIVGGLGDFFSQTAKMRGNQ